MAASINAAAEGDRGEGAPSGDATTSAVLAPIRRLRIDWSEPKEPVSDILPRSGVVGRDQGA